MWCRLLITKTHMNTQTNTCRHTSEGAPHMNIGGMPNSSSKPVLLRFEYHSFPNLPSSVDNVVESDMKTDCNGNSWRLQLYPAGCSDAVEEGMIALILLNVGETNVTAKFTMMVRNLLGELVLHESNHAFHLFPSHGKEGYGYGYNDTKCLKRKRILDVGNKILFNGTFQVDVSIQVKPQKDEIYYPPAQHIKNMLALLRSGEDADVLFLIEGKRQKAHLSIIRANAPFLADLFKDQMGAEKDVPLRVVDGRLYSRRHSFTFGFEPTKSDWSLVLNDMSAEVLFIILRYVYGGLVPDDHTKFRLAKELIKATHRFRISELKMLVENALVEECVINTKNVVEYLLLAEANECPLLKEYAMTYFVLHVEDVNSKQTKKLQEAPELMNEILVAVAKVGNNTAQRSSFGVMTVSELRKELGYCGLDVHGSKEVLIARLEGSI